MKKHYDFSQGHRGAVVKTDRERITLRLDAEIIQWFRDQVEGGGNYQTLINDALCEHIRRQQGNSLEDTLRRVIREELRV